MPKWLPGQSGNPKGKPKGTKSVDKEPISRRLRERLSKIPKGKSISFYDLLIDEVMALLFNDDKTPDKRVKRWALEWIADRDEGRARLRSEETDQSSIVEQLLERMNMMNQDELPPRNVKNTAEQPKIDTDKVKTIEELAKQIGDKE